MVLGGGTLILSLVASRHSGLFVWPAGVAYEFEVALHCVFKVHQILGFQNITVHGIGVVLRGEATRTIARFVYEQASCQWWRPA